ncbi:hypothetical protein QYH69_22820 [Paraburkholderia sp. SARCC-3016]|nr:hypothetical protein [Paraburkholderia sp. SARCC-3016]MDQ7980079.1 hypothetical protein [Paraburkholderia sp. SARCC-3016]
MALDAARTVLLRCARSSRHDGARDPRFAGRRAAWRRARFRRDRRRLVRTARRVAAGRRGPPRRAV